jgi:hypothetical protein
MKEQEWLTCQDPDLMLYHLQSAVSERKGRLFAVACLRRIWALVTDPRSRRIVEVVERHIERKASDDEWAAASQAASEAWGDSSRLLHPQFYGIPDCPLTATERTAAEALNATTNAAHTIGRGGIHAVPGHEGRALSHSVARETARAVNSDYQQSPERARQADLLRCIFGNPFRPVALDRAWLTSTVTALASQMYESRDFGAMPILADALQDAGCENDDVLSHCRNPGPHARGCWVVDLVLGKS